MPVQMLQRMEARRQQASEAEVAGMERRMEEVRENVRKAEVCLGYWQAVLGVCVLYLHYVCIGLWVPELRHRQVWP